MRNASNGRSKKKNEQPLDLSMKENEAKPKAHEPVPKTPIEKNRSKYMQSLGIVAKGQESILQFVKRPTEQTIQAPSDKNLEQKLAELNRPSQHISKQKMEKEEAASKDYKDLRFEDEVE